MSVFDINYTSLIKQLLPVRLRMTVQRAWLGCLVNPVIYLYNLFYANRLANLYELAHNSQVCYLQAALNDMFNNSDRLIYVADGFFRDPLWLYRRSEAKPVWLGRRSEVGSVTFTNPEPLYTRSEVSAMGWQFIVYYPDGLVFDENQMRALVDKYRLAGKWHYGILPYTP